MRTTLDIDDDVLAAVKELARRERKTAGALVSELVRRALAGPMEQPSLQEPPPTYVPGFRPFPSRGGLLTNQAIDRLRDEEGI